MGDRARQVRVFVHTADGIPRLSLHEQTPRELLDAETVTRVCIRGRASDVGDVCMFMKDCPPEPPLMDPAWYQDGICLRHVRWTVFTDDADEHCDDCVGELARKVRSRRSRRRKV